MPIVTSHRVKRRENYQTEGSQYIENVLTLPTAPDTSTIFLGREVYNTGTYVLFDYSESTSGTPVTGSLSQVTVDVSDLPWASSATLANDTARECITVTIQGAATNGTQYITGILNISAPMTIYLSYQLFASAGTYTLFDYSAGSFVGSITNITVVPPAGRFIDTSVSPNGCATSGSTITVKLL